MQYRSWMMAAVVATVASVTQADVLSLQFVPVGNPGNAADPATGSLYGSVPYTYQMGKYDVTVGQYCQFLNAVAKTDTYGLYYGGMATDMPTFHIAQNGSSGSYSYSVTGGYSQGANCPVFDVTWGDAARFCNWLQNGQPTSGVENASTTENGAYTLNGATSNPALMAITRNSGATYFIPSENEWYKAAYYDPNKPGGAGYWTYPTKSNTAPINTLPDTGNHANFYDDYGTGNRGYTDPTNYLTPVGAFAASPGPYGTYDMGGDVWQWNETAVTGSSRGARGGDWHYFSDDLAASDRQSVSHLDYPTYEGYYMGFRVAGVPEPDSIALLLAGFLCLLAYAWRRQRKLHNLRSMILAAMVVLAAGSAQADNVFNMGGTRDPTTGTWTGLASLEFVPVGNPGNAADPATGSLYGSVPYSYQMGKYDVTVGQYTAFLNAVAKTDAYGLYNSRMATDMQTIGITQSGSSGNYTYAVAGGYAGTYSQAANCPVFDVTWGDAARFSNWLQNGQPTSGVENATTTENGAYTLNGAVSDAALMAVTRNAGATYFIPSENEWYKAAYYDPNKPGGAGYWAYPTKSNTAPGNTLPDAGNGANYGNYTDLTNYLTPVGAFALSPGPYGTYDQGGDVRQWNEANIASSWRGVRGGDWLYGSYDLASFYRNDDGPPNEYNYLLGFRVASVPEPGTIVLVVAGGLCLLAYAWRRRRV